MDTALFRAAQDPIWSQVMAELSAGRKETHWMWFVFPQLTALGRSGTARRYGLDDLDAARSYLADPVLGARLREAAEAVLAHADRAAEDILGPIDAMKLRSSATLFEAAGGGETFASIIDTFYGGERDPLTLDLIKGRQT